MNSRAAVLAAVAGLCACSDRPDPEPVVRDVEGAFASFRWTDDGARTRQNDGTSVGSALTALVPTADGYRTYPGTLRSDGTFSVPGVEGAAYYLSLDRRAVGDPTVYVWEATDATLPLLVSQEVAGRADAARATEATPVTLDVRGLEPWVSRLGVLEATSTNAGLWAPLGGEIYGAVDLAAGATESGGASLDWAAAPGRGALPLPDALHGDDLWIHQLQPRTVAAGEPGAGLEYLSAVRFARATDVSLAEGAAATLSVTLAEPAETAVTRVTLPATAWETLADEVNPLATAAPLTVLVSANPFTAAHPAPSIPGGAPDLALLSVPPGGPDLAGVPLAHGRFFDPGRYAEVARASFAATVQYLASGATRPLGMVAGGLRAVAVASGAVDLTPDLTPPQRPLVARRDLFQLQAGVGVTPLLEWSPPRLGSPTSYQIAIYRLGRQSDGGTSATRVLQATLARPRFRVPAGLLASGSAYFAWIAARRAPFDGPGYLSSFGFPYSTASCLTSLFEP